MLHTDVVNLIKESGRMITLAIGPPIQQHGKKKTNSFDFILNFFVENDRLMDNHTPSNGIRPSSSTSPMVISDGNNQTLRNAFSHNPLNTAEKYDWKSHGRDRIILRYLEHKVDHHLDRMAF